MRTFFEQILDLPELRLFFDYWYIWIGLIAILLFIAKYSNKS